MNLDDYDDEGGYRQIINELDDLSATISVGDTVVIRSNTGPVMTVLLVSHGVSINAPSAKCFWFEKHPFSVGANGIPLGGWICRTHDFPLLALKPAYPPSEKK